MQTDADKQRILQEFVDKEVIYCVSSLVCELAGRAGLNMCDEFPELFESPPNMGDYTCPECDQTWETEPEADCYICPHCGFNGIEDEDYEVTEYQEIFEHWIVSDWLANKLAERGEAICKDFYSLTVWGRTCTGQSIIFDSVIEDIYDTLLGIKKC